MFKQTIGVLLSLFIFSTANSAMVQGTYLGTYAGNDTAAGIFAILGITVNELARVEIPEDEPTYTSGGLTVTDLVPNGDIPPEYVAGDWDYTGPGLVDFIVIKAGNMYAIYQYTDLNTGNMRNMGIWDTGDVDNMGLSHITAYQITAVPVPAAVWLMGTALLSLSGMSRRRSVIAP